MKRAALALSAATVVAAACAPEPRTLRGKWQHASSPACAVEFTPDDSGDRSHGYIDGCTTAGGEHIEKGTYDVGNGRLRIRFTRKEPVGDMYIKETPVDETASISWNKTSLTLNGATGEQKFARATK